MIQVPEIKIITHKNGYELIVKYDEKEDRSFFYTNLVDLAKGLIIHADQMYKLDTNIKEDAEYLINVLTNQSVMKNRLKKKSTIQYESKESVRISYIGEVVIGGKNIEEIRNKWKNLEVQSDEAILAHSGNIVCVDSVEDRRTGKNITKKFCK